MESQQGTLTNEIGLKEQLIQAFDEAYEKLIATVTQAEKQRDKAQNNTWGPREILGHIAGWAAQATAFIPQVIAGLPPQTYASDFQHQTIDDAFNIAFIALLENQTFEQVLSLAHQTHQCFMQMLREQPEAIFIPDNPAYERMKRVIDHHLEHAEELEAVNADNHR